MKVGSQFDGGRVAEIVQLPGTADWILLVEYAEEARRRTGRNIFRANENLEIVWRAEPAPEYMDYCAMRIESSDVIASSWSGYRVRLSQDQGRILEKVFTK